MGNLKMPSRKLFQKDWENIRFGNIRKIADISAIFVEKSPIGHSPWAKIVSIHKELRELVNDSRDIETKALHGNE